jgi:predicted Fe-Mo cluster-binding NifX family protein
MPKVAIPIFFNRVSPRLDCARQVLVLEIGKNGRMRRSELDISQWQPDEKIYYLHRLGVEEVICGGIRHEDRAGLNQLGIRISSPVFGEVGEVIQGYLAGTLGNPCRRMRRKQGRRGAGPS